MAAALCFIRTPKIDVDRLVHKISQFFSASARLWEKLRAGVFPVYWRGVSFFGGKTQRGGSGVRAFFERLR